VVAGIRGSCGSAGGASLSNEKFTRHVTFTVQPSVWAQVQDAAQSRAVQPSSILRMALAEFLARDSTKEKSGPEI
jgi:hypothetical protein